MPKAAVNPEDLRRFAFELKRFNEDLQTEIASIQRRFVKLGETWQDQEQAKFAETFEQMVKALSKFVDASNKHVPFLLRKAERIQDYLEQK
jgi:uncharacterized protein YukE